MKKSCRSSPCYRISLWGVQLLPLFAPAVKTAGGRNPMIALVAGGGSSRNLSSPLIPPALLIPFEILLEAVA